VIGIRTENTDYNGKTHQKCNSGIREVEVGLWLLQKQRKRTMMVVGFRGNTGTAEIKWIKKNTLLQHKSRLSIPGLKKELQKCYRVRSRIT